MPKKLTTQEAFAEVLQDQRINYNTRKTWKHRMDQGNLTDGFMYNILCKYGYTPSITWKFGG